MQINQTMSYNFTIAFSYINKKKTLKYVSGFLFSYLVHNHFVLLGSLTSYGFSPAHYTVTKQS